MVSQWLPRCCCLGSRCQIFNTVTSPYLFPLSSYESVVGFNFENRETFTRLTMFSQEVQQRRKLGLIFFVRIYRLWYLLIFWNIKVRKHAGTHGVREHTFQRKFTTLSCEVDREKENNLSLVNKNEASPNSKNFSEYCNPYSSFSGSHKSTPLKNTAA